MWIFTAVALVLSVTFSHAVEHHEGIFTDKLVLVTGAAQGIGRALVDRILENGAHCVVMVDKQKELGEEAAKALNDKYGENKALFYCADVTTDLDIICEDLKAKNYGALDVLFNNAGIVDENNPERTIRTNLLAPIEWTTKVYELTRKDKGGKGCTIYNIASMYAYVEEPFLPFYKACSSGLQSYSKTMGHPYRHEKTGVSVVCVNPGFTNTKMLEGQLEKPELENLYRNYAEKAWKMQSADEVASAIMRMCPIAESGTSWTIDGGELYMSPASDYYDAAFIRSFEHNYCE